MSQAASIPSSWRTTAAMALAILVLVAFAQGPAWRGGLVWDDAAHVTKPELQSLGGLGRIWAEPGATQQYYPVLHSAFWLEHQLWGDATVGYHVTNMALHALAALLFARVLGRVGPRLPVGTEWLAAVLLAVHPVTVESVAWISEQKNTLSLVFYLAAALAYLNFEASRSRRWYVVATGWFLLALGTKTVTATLPAALLVMLWWRDGRLRAKRDLPPLLPWFAAALAAGSVTAWVERTYIGAQGASFDLSLGERGLLAGRVVWFYLGKLLWPVDLMFIYPRWDVRAEAAHWWPWLLAAGAVTAGLWALRRRTRGPLAAWLFFGGSLFPALGFVNVYPFLFSYVADHFQYLAMLGPIAMIATAGAWMWARSGALGRVGLATGGLMIVATLGWLARTQSATYRDGETLYRATLAKNPACWMAHSNLATQLAERPAGVPEALEHFAAALRLNPERADTRNNFGNTLGALGRDAEAEAQFREALRLQPDFIEARLNLANLLAKNPARREEALVLYEEALRLRPGYAETHYSRATSLADIPGRETEAEREYREALRLQPGHAPAAAGLADLLSTQPERREEAEHWFRQAVAFDPRSAKPHYNYGLWLENSQNRLDEAAAEYEAALRCDPRHARSLNNLGILCARKRDFAGARRYWEVAMQADPTYPDPPRNLQVLAEQFGQ